MNKKIKIKRGNISWALKQMKNGKLNVFFGRLKNHLEGYLNYMAHNFQIEFS